MPAAKPLDKPVLATDPVATSTQDSPETVQSEPSPLDRLTRLEAIVEQLQDNLYGVNVRPAVPDVDSDGKE